jgi:isocitrate/isopropylmalate dehydrogenase
MLDHLGDTQGAERVQGAILRTLAQASSRTRDVGGVLGTADFTNMVIGNLR